MGECTEQEALRLGLEQAMAEGGNEFSVLYAWSDIVTSLHMLFADDTGEDAMCDQEADL